MIQPVRSSEVLRRYQSERKIINRCAGGNTATGYPDPTILFCGTGFIRITAFSHLKLRYFTSFLSRTFSALRTLLITNSYSVYLLILRIFFISCVFFVPRAAVPDQPGGSG